MDIYTYEYFLQEDVCCLCWNRNANTTLFVENTDNLTEPSLVDLIKEYLDIDIIDTKPNKLCEKCCDEIKRFHTYKKLCQENYIKLQNILQKGLEELNNKIVLNEVKIEEIDNDFDNLEDVLADTTEAEESTQMLTNSKFRKKFLHKLSPTYCRICCLEFRSKEELTSHESEEHGIENEGTLFKCLGCEKRFKSRRSCNSHEVKFCKALKNGYKCEVCDRYLPRRIMYEYHMRDHTHNTLTELPEHMFKCNKCIKLFKTRELLKTHMLEHVEVKNFVCDTCGRVFTRQDYLHKHKLTHTGDKHYQCPHCEFRASQRSSLTVHIRKHTGERPYSCDLCPQRCISSSNLRAHLRRHLGVKKFECAICNKKFGYKVSLEEHIASTHVRSETHACEHCGATYTRLRGLRRHLASKHGQQNKSKSSEQNLIVQGTENSSKNIQIIKNVEYELKDSENVLLLKHQDGDVHLV